MYEEFRQLALDDAKEHYRYEVFLGTEIKK